MPGKRIFYGWWIVAASIVGMSTNPGQFVYGSMGLFIKPLGDEFGWDRAQVSFATTLFTLTLALTFPIIGALVDRYGSRCVLLPSMLVVAGCLAAIPHISELWHLLFIFVVCGSLGAGANSLPYFRTISAWFDRRRGLAIGLVVAGAGIGYMYVPPLVQYLIETAGWRSAYYALAAIIVVVALPTVALVFREHPAGMGLSVDGDGDNGPNRIGADADRKITPADKVVVESGYSRVEALHSRVFWLLATAFSVLAFCLYGFMVHLIPMLTDRGMPAAKAALVFSAMGLVIVAARVVIGYLIDLYFAPRVTFVCLLLSASGLLLLGFETGASMTFFAVLLVGISIGAELDLMGFLTSRYFGLRAFGQIYALMFTAFMLGASLGPIVYGNVFEANGSYVSILLLAAALVGLVCVLIALLPAYPRFENVRAEVQ